MSAQRKAAIWHWVDFFACGSLFTFALVGLIGHYKLRKQYEEESILFKGLR